MAGSANEAEQTLVEEYLRRMEVKGPGSVDVSEEQAIRENIWKKIQQHTKEPSAHKIAPVRRIKTSFKRIAVAAAAACLLLLIILNPWEKINIGTGNLITVVGEGEPIRKIKLADGSLVWLKANSTLTYPREFKGKTREIDLKGEALFEVSKNPAQPFIVHSNSMDVKVLGTSFNIKDNKASDIVEIAVLTGKVWVKPTMENSNNNFELLPTERLTINNQNKSVSKGNVTSVDRYLQGTEYDMHFFNTPIDSIARRIEAKFDVTVLMGEKPNIDCRLNGDFTDQSLSHTLILFCQSLNAAYAIANDTVRISNIKCK